ncbi:protein transport protein SEC31 homolog B-like isoform X1 [Trifolium pratense]|uniref:protein transport protein SEC31 homolog B-like isoform X1 n=1 Tax=Trifolium pratense TaxID=57577 RepID=UPI001E696F1C|nr:protein transport protein SEC31 homolog B-like isoform X1 [Trifolium pratense]
MRFAAFPKFELESGFVLGKSYVDLLQKRFSASLCKLVDKYAEILASQGLLTIVMEYLKLLGSEELSIELVVILKDRIALSTEPAPTVSTVYLWGETVLLLKFFLSVSLLVDYVMETLISGVLSL